jgi:hypothetical protein
MKRVDFDPLIQKPAVGTARSTHRGDIPVAPKSLDEE